MMVMFFMTSVGGKDFIGQTYFCRWTCWNWDLSKYFFSTAQMLRRGWQASIRTHKIFFLIFRGNFWTKIRTWCEMAFKMKGNFSFLQRQETALCFATRDSSKWNWWKVLDQPADRQWILCVLSIEHPFVIWGNIYKYNNINHKKSLLLEIYNLFKDLKYRYPAYNIILGGDFNMVYNEWLDRSPTKFHIHQYNPHQVKLCSSHNRIDHYTSNFKRIFFCIRQTVQIGLGLILG